MQGVAGLYDYGPPGTAIKTNLLTSWRNHFVLEEDMLEIETVSVTPSVVFEVSGHCAKFTDLMVKNEITKAFYRADHLLEAAMDKIIADPATPADKVTECKRIAAQVDDYDAETLGMLLKRFDVRDPEDGGVLSAPYPFNLMFETSIGPAGVHKGYLRPETAQGIFVNFPRLLEYNGGRVPFAGATIGPAFRNEISPRAGLLRVREFTLAEIEHFIDPSDDVHPKLATVANVVVTLYPRDNQTTSNTMVRMTIGDAVRSALIGHTDAKGVKHPSENLGYFIARTHLWLTSMGAHPECLRFRQHLSNEMAHYAIDCWDAELLTSYGWIEVVGHANRACYDLSVHSAASKVGMHFFKSFAEPVQREVLRTKLNKGPIGATFKAEGKALMEHLDSLVGDQCVPLQQALAETGECVVHVHGKDFKLTKAMLAIELVKEKISGEQVTPSVIEPSYGIGRILYSLLEQAYWVRNGDKPAERLTVDELAAKKKALAKGDTEMIRSVLSLVPALAPVKCSVLPLFSSNADMMAYIPRVTTALKQFNITHKVDSASQNIGRRYARTDELGVPFGITIDFDTIKDEGKGLLDTVTLRDRDTTEQVRVPSSEIAQVISNLCNGQITWVQVAAKYPRQLQSQQQ